MRDAEREAETQAEGEAGSTQGAQCGTQSRVSRITLWAEGRHQTAGPPGLPCVLIFMGELQTREERAGGFGNRRAG